MVRTRGSLFVSEWLIFAACVLAMGAVLGYTNFRDYAHITDNERQRLATAATVTSDVMRHQLFTIGTTLQNVRRDLRPGWLAKQEAVAVCRERLKTVVGAMTSVQGILVMDPAGKIVTATRDDLIGLILPQRQYLQAPMHHPDHDTLYVSPPYQSVFGSLLLNLTYALSGQSGEFAGVVSAALDPKVLAVLLGSVRYADDAWIAFVHGNGTLFVWEPERSDVVGKSLAVPGSLFTRFVESGQDSAVLEGTTYATGEPSMIALRRIQPEELHMDGPLFIAVGRNLEAVYAPWWHGLWRSLLIYALLVLGGIAGLTIVQHRRRVAIRDLEERDAQLRVIQSELETLFTLAPSLLGIGDLQGTFRKLNPAWEKWLGYASAELEGLSCLDFIHPQDREATMARIAELVQGQTITNYVARFRHKDGTYRFIEWQAAARDGCIYAAAQDVTQRQELERTLEQMAYHDRLTGLANRALLFDRLSQALFNARRKQTLVAILFIDLDGFKGVNDQYGHDSGDLVLKTIAERFLARVRATDTVARTGGDEFVIVLNELSRRDEAGLVAQNLLEAVAPDIALASGTTCRVGASIGISLFPLDGTDMDTLLMVADAAMYQAKKAGKNRSVFADDTCRTAGKIVLDSRHLVGVDEIDRQHEGLVLLINHLLEAARTHDDQSALESLIDELAGATAQHFAAEHTLMQRYAYPRQAGHEAAHEYLLAEVGNFRGEICKGGDQFMFSQLEAWLLEHILAEDLALGNFLREQQGSAS